MNPESRIIIDMEKLNYAAFTRLHEFMSEIIGHEELYKDLISISYIESTKEFIATIYDENHHEYVDLTYKDIIEENIRHLR